MLKDNIDEESEGNDYVVDDDVDQDSTDESDDDAGEADDSTANGTYLCWYTTWHIFVLSNICIGMNKRFQTDDWRTKIKSVFLLLFSYEYGDICFFMIMTSLDCTIACSIDFSLKTKLL